MPESWRKSARKANQGGGKHDLFSTQGELVAATERQSKEAEGQGSNPSPVYCEERAAPRSQRTTAVLALCLRTGEGLLIMPFTSQPPIYCCWPAAAGTGSTALAAKVIEETAEGRFHGAFIDERAGGPGYRPGFF